MIEKTTDDGPQTTEPAPDPSRIREATEEATPRRPWRPYALVLGALALLVVLWLVLRPGGAGLREVAEVAVDPDGMDYFDAGIAPFAVEVRDLLVPYDTFMLAALPGERVTIRAAAPAGEERGDFAAHGGSPRAPATPGSGRRRRRRASTPSA